MMGDFESSKMDKESAPEVSFKDMMSDKSQMNRFKKTVLKKPRKKQ